MAYLIDGYNCMHAGAAMGGAFARMDVRGLCRWITSSGKGRGATVVLDGRAKPDEPGENEFPEVTLVYSGAGVKADRVIEQKVERSEKRSKITVVSNDRAVVLHARRNGAHAMSCEAFLAMLAGTPEAAEAAARSRLAAQKAAPKQSPGETEHWMKEFGVEMLGPAQERPRQGDEELGDLDIEDLLGPPGG